MAAGGGSGPSNLRRFSEREASLSGGKVRGEAGELILGLNHSGEGLWRPEFRSVRRPARPPVAAALPRQIDDEEWWGVSNGPVLCIIYRFTAHASPRKQQTRSTKQGGSERWGEGIIQNHMFPLLFFLYLSGSLSCNPDLLDPSRAVPVFFFLSSIPCFAICPILYLSMYQITSTCLFVLVLKWFGVPSCGLLTIGIQICSDPWIFFPIRSWRGRRQWAGLIWGWFYSTMVTAAVVPSTCSMKCLQAIPYSARPREEMERNVIITRRTRLHHNGVTGVAPGMECDYRTVLMSHARPPTDGAWWIRTR